MRVYFTSSVPCALKLNGIFLGVCDDREKFTDITPEEEIFAEFVPADGGLLSANCILNKSFFQSPPDFCDLYLYDCGAHIHIREFSEKPGNLNVIDQKRINGVLVTPFHNGGIHLSLESEKDFFTEQLPPQARYAEISSLTLNGRNLISLVIPEEADSILLIYDKTRPLFKNRVSKFEIKDTLCADFAFRDTAGHIAHSEWKLGEEGFTLDSYTVQETNQVNHEDERLIPYLFFEALLVHGDFIRYLSPELAERKDELHDYLGKFTGVCIPPSVFYLAHGNINAVGLICPKSENIFEIRFFSATIENGKITNILPVEN